MDIYLILLSVLTEAELLKIGEACAVGGAPRTAMGVLQGLAGRRISVRQIVAQIGAETAAKVCERAGIGVGVGAGTGAGGDARAALIQAAGDGEREPVSVEVLRRRPRLAWRGMERRPAVVAVPVQMTEVVTARMAVQEGRQVVQQGLVSRAAQLEARAPVGRLIWTNDNLVALRTLLDERDSGGDWRYRGKVDLVYIDPPFMVNSDFVADNAINVDVDEEEGISAKKEPSLVEVLAYKDTWEHGLDSFLSMIRARLVLLKELLSPTGSIYVHLDWHAAHYVKVMMDEIFGYENFRNQIIWKRSSAHSDHSQGAVHYGRISDLILFYSGSSGKNKLNQQFIPYSAEYIARDYSRIDSDGRKYRLDNIQGPGGAAKGNPYYTFLGVARYWRFSEEKMKKLYDEGRIIQLSSGSVPQYKRYLDEMFGIPVQELWDDLLLNNRSNENNNYPTQKPIALLERIISASCPPGGLVLDCFGGSGTTAEAAERLGRRWISIDISKYAIHVARKRLIALSGQARGPERQEYDYVECAACRQIERKPRRQKGAGVYQVRPFSMELMGVYQRAEAWLSQLGQPGAWRPEMVRVYGGEPHAGDPLLHGRKGEEWIHVGPLDAPVPPGQVWAIAQAVAEVGGRQLTVLSADIDALEQGERDKIFEARGVRAQVRIIPQAALEAVARRLNRQAGADGAQESMAIPAFYAPLTVSARVTTAGRKVTLVLERCEVDVEAFIQSQRPALRDPEAATTPAARKKAAEEQQRWASRQATLRAWLEQARSWVSFVDFWEVDWNYGLRVDAGGRPVLDAGWQSFRRRGRGKVEPVVLEAETVYPLAGRYRVGVCVTDVFGNDGRLVLDVEVR